MRKLFSKLNQPWLRKTVKISLISLKWLFILLLVGGILGGSTVFGYVSALVKDDPLRSREAMMQQMQENAITGFVYFNDDKVIGQLRSEEDRRLAALGDIPQIVLNAVFSIEDNDFYNHHGIDIRGLFRAVSQKVLNEDVQTGGSTITQQLARRVFLTLDRDTGRKAKELLLALRMERLMTKDEILLAYLNKIPYGNGSAGYNLYGIKAAAKGIFNPNDLKDLNVAQAAYLAGLPQQPSNYSAFTSKGQFDPIAFKRAIARQQLVLKRMQEENKITQDQYQEALKFDIKATLAEPMEKAYNTYPYLMLEAEKEAAEILLKMQKPNLDPKKDQAAYNEALKSMHAQLLHGGYQIYTTIDQTIYDSMHAISDNPTNFTPNDPKKGMEQIGAVMLDSKTSAILGMIEGREFLTEQLNHATQSTRQPGSAMKPIAAYIPAIEKGAIGPASVIDDVPIILKDGTSKGFHIPGNWDLGYHGLITVREALNQSYNIPAIKLFLNTVGIDEAWSFAKKLGITTIQKEDYYAQTGVIGGLKYGVSVKELTNAYASIANKGVFNEAYLIRKITDANGKVIFEHVRKPSSVFSEETSFLITDMMRTVITQGTAKDIMNKFKYYGKTPVAGKTGSTQDDTDAWFMGFSPDITLGVWAGYDQPINKLSKATGGTSRAKNIWALVMNATEEKKPDLFTTKEFKRPNTIIEATVSDLSGKLPSEMTIKSNHVVTDIFNKKYVPTEVDDVMVNMNIISYNGRNYMAQPSTPTDMVKQKTVIKREKSIGKLLDEIEALIKKLPSDKQKSIDSYKPNDYDEDAPSDPDPRVDDGKEPVSPTTVVATKSNDTAVVTFQASSSSDVVGYRIYRSENHGTFQRMNDKVILAGQETKFTDHAAPSSVIGYYVTAVDVAGKESPPSKIASTDGSSIDSLFLPQTPGAIQDNGSNPSHKDAPSTPTGMKVKTEGAALKINWTANPSKEKVKLYNVYYSDKESGIFKKLGTTENTTEFNYYAVLYDGFYKITAVNDAGESKPSAPFVLKSN